MWGEKLPDDKTVWWGGGKKEAAESDSNDEAEEEKEDLEAKRRAGHVEMSIRARVDAASGQMRVEKDKGGMQLSGVREDLKKGINKKRMEKMSETVRQKRETKRSFQKLVSGSKLSALRDSGFGF